jgi:divalent metal cation (Fe/Co/Zn/Cd) transporter
MTSVDLPHPEGPTIERNSPSATSKLTAPAPLIWGLMLLHFAPRAARVAILATTMQSTVARTGRRLQYASIGWNSLEAVVAVGAGAVAGSIALVGFGVDSAIEVTASAAALWRLASDGDAGGRQTAERRALHIIGGCFLALAAYVLYESALALLARRPPDVSRVGIVLAALSLVVMPLLVRLKRRVARQLGSLALEAESRQTLLCAVLSAILLGGLGLNAALGWWWADPVAGLAMTPLIAREGWGALRGEPCCAT